MVTINIIAPNCTETTGLINRFANKRDNAAASCQYKMKLAAFRHIFKVINTYSIEFCE